LWEQGWPQAIKEQVGHTLLAQGWPQDIKPWLKNTGGPHFVGARLVSSQLKHRWGTLLLEQGWPQAIKQSSYGLTKTGGPHFVGAGSP
jgi:hypothetical protein